MARIYRTVKVGMWRDEKFRRLSALKPSGQALWIYLLTGPHTGIIPGLCECGEAQLAEVLDWPIEAFREAFREVFAEGIAKADWKARLLWMPNATIHNPPASPNVVRAWRQAIDELPECQLLLEATKQLKDFTEGLGEAFAEAFQKPSPKALLNQDQEQKQKQKTKKKKPAPPNEPSDKPTGSTKIDDCPPKKLADPKVHIIRQLLSLWDRVYAVEIGSVYIRTSSGKEAASAKRLEMAATKAGCPPGTVEAAMRRFHSDGFWRGKDFSSFANNFAQFTIDRPRRGERFTESDPLFKDLDRGDGKNSGGNLGLLTGGLSGGAERCDDGDPPSMDGRLSRHG